MSPGSIPAIISGECAPSTSKNKLSDASDAYKFTLVAQGKEQEMLLEVDGTELQGNVVEVIGRTEPGAALIINGEASGGHSARRTVSAISPSR